MDVKVKKVQESVVIEFGDIDISIFTTGDELFCCFTSFTSPERVCYLYNFYAKYCAYKKPCRECPAAEYFIELPDGDVVPVWKFKY